MRTVFAHRCGGSSGLAASRAPLSRLSRRRRAPCAEPSLGDGTRGGQSASPPRARPCPPGATVSCRRAILDHAIESYRRQAYLPPVAFRRPFTLHLRCRPGAVAKRPRQRASRERPVNDANWTGPPEAAASIWVAGIGCRRGCPADAIRDLLASALDECGIEAASLDRLASIEGKGNEPGLLAVAAELGLSLSVWSGAILRCFEGRLATHSRHARAATGCSGVAESAALAAASDGDPDDPGTTLALPRRSNGRATIAIACRRPHGVEYGSC